MSDSISDVIRYDIVRPRVAQITLAKPETRNAQDTELLYDLNAAFDRAAQDDDVSVIVLAAEGPHFSSGHDLREQDYPAAMAAHETVGTWCGFGCAGAEGHMAREKEIYLGFSERWRNIPKPTIAAVHGKVIAGGLMLAWPCDLIIAADDTQFIDNTVAMGVNGVEFFHHPWELGVRRAKEMLFTSDVVTAADAFRLGMINRVVPRAELEDTALELAERIARMPLFALKLTKESINAAQDAQGRPQALQTSFALHQLAHTHNRVRFGDLIDPRFARP
ncbi:enoyl-CoA hydratase [Nocardia sp. FBN12]|uniref:enoyl-CoA hydratase n=1 Tax=Nocardia sp. FBN12 TaxID=3419766 RepID=UPI003CFC4F8C